MPGVASRNVAHQVRPGGLARDGVLPVRSPRRGADRRHEAMEGLVELGAGAPNMQTIVDARVMGKVR